MSTQVCGVVALLDDEHTIAVKALWDELEKECGLTAILETPFPHVSWHVAEGYDIEPLEEKIAQIADQTPPFMIRTAGLGVFSNETPVVYIPVVKDPNLSRLHNWIWEEAQRFGKEIRQQYSPDQWIPHITLAARDVTREDLPSIFSIFANRSFNWEIKIDCFALGCQPPDGVAEITRRFPLHIDE